MSDFMRKFSLVCDWYAETDFLSFEHDLVFKFNIKGIEDTLEEQAGSNEPEMYNKTLQNYLDVMSLIGREFQDWPLVRGE